MNSINLLLDIHDWIPKLKIDNTWIPEDALPVLDAIEKSNVLNGYLCTIIEHEVDAHRIWYLTRRLGYYWNHHLFLSTHSLPHLDGISLEVGHQSKKGHESGSLFCDDWADCINRIDLLEMAFGLPQLDSRSNKSQLSLLPERPSFMELINQIIRETH